jgi:putative addiction module killer protein
MREVVTLPKFEEWLDDLKDHKARGVISKRVDRMRADHFGDARPVGEGVSEARIHFGPGYRVYFAQAGATIVVLLCGGSKRTQGADIKEAKRLWKEFRWWVS